MPKGPVASMDVVGFITEPSVKIDRAIAYWFANRIDQCIIIRDVKSYQYVVASHQDDKKSEEKFLQDIKTNLRDYLLQIFDGATVEARALRKEEGDKMFTLALSGIVQQDGAVYQINKSVLINGSTYLKVDKGRALNG